eukprot:UN20240
MGYCSLTNYISMALDCLDGMHARATNQCSRVGELLDHWTDSFSVPIIASSFIMVVFKHQSRMDLALAQIPPIVNR